MCSINTRRCDWLNVVIERLGSVKKAAMVQWGNYSAKEEPWGNTDAVLKTTFNNLHPNHRTDHWRQAEACSNADEEEVLSSTEDIIISEKHYPNSSNRKQKS